MTLVSEPVMLSPGATIGILGAGQLGRMLALAAARLGFRCAIFSDVDGPARDVAFATTIAPYGDGVAREKFARACDVITLEFENVPVGVVQHMAKFCPVRPGAKALAVAQDRVAEKRCAENVGAATAPFLAIDSAADLSRALAGPFAPPAILKARRMGYDGKGQVRIKQAAEAEQAWAAIGAKPAVLEGMVPFAFEVSVIAVRGVDGAFQAYDIPENVHRDGILHTSTVPSRIEPRAAVRAIEITRAIGAELEYVGVFAVEFFVVVDASGQQDVLVNEIAPRVHNSGHWTIDACVVSQFENQIRAVAGWPLGDPRRHSNAQMANLIGAEIETAQKLAAAPNTAVHHYGKSDARQGRKMGHVTRLLPMQPVR